MKKFIIIALATVITTAASAMPAGSTKLVRDSFNIAVPSRSPPGE